MFGTPGFCLKLFVLITLYLLYVNFLFLCGSGLERIYDMIEPARQKKDTKRRMNDAVSSNLFREKLVKMHMFPISHYLEWRLQYF